jgi:hypothetical protein
MRQKSTRKSLSTSLSLWAKKHRWLSAITALALLVTGVGIGLGVRNNNNDRLVNAAGSEPSSSGGTSSSAASGGASSAGSTPSSSTAKGTKPTASATTSTGGSASQPGTSGGSGSVGGAGSAGSGSKVPNSGTMFGASLDLANGGGFSQALAAQDSRFGKLGVVRVFYPGLPAAWASRPELANRTSVVSFKLNPADVLSGANDSRLLNWFNTAPRSAQVYWSYWHEPENDKQLNLAQYRAAWQHITALSRRANNPNLHATLILMGYTVHQGSGRDWHDYYPGSASVDVMGWDVYNTGAKKGKYTDPASLYGPVAAVARSVGKPWGIAETASKVVDSTSARASWLRSTTSYLDGAGAQFVAYWDVNANGGSYKLTDQPGISAWRAAVALST